jgi:small subunit ribosomal protein S1
MSKRRSTTENVEILPRKKVVKALARGMEMQGRVRRLAGFGAFVDIGVGTDGLLHISELDPNRRITTITDMLSVGDEVTVWIKDLDRENNRISLTMVPPGTLTIAELQAGMTLTGTVTRLAPYGAFVDIGVGRDGMLHVREMGDGFVRSAGDVVRVGEAIEVRVLTVDKRRGRVDLTMKGLHPEEATSDDPEEAEEEEPPTTMEMALREAMDGQPILQPREAKSRNKHRREDQQRLMDDIISRTIESHRQAA